MQIENPYHEGELLVQQRVNEVEAAKQNGRIISTAIPKGALKFIEQQPMVVLGSIDAQQNIWASVLMGHPGFIKAVNQYTVELNLTQAVCNWYEPFWTNIKCHAQVGVLVIELASRRRLRLNGHITRTAPKRLQLEVAESYPNCPKYIQRRHTKIFVGESWVHSCISEPRVGQSLEPDQQAFIAGADTFFVASAHLTRGVDASHRGGNPGFIRILDDRTLCIPDYVGNSMFNTLGNFVVNPKAGLIFLDFERSRTLQLIGQPKILWELDEPMHVTGDKTSLSGIVYTESNIPTENGNTILGFHRDAEGNLTPLPGSPFATGGAGIVDPTFDLSNATLGSDQEIIINPEHTRLFAVNSGSNTISVFNIAPNGSLSPVEGSPFPSGGVEPVSLALAGDFLYVANKNRDPQDPTKEPSNSLPNYTGFRVHDNGKLTPIKNSTVEVPHNSAPAHVLTSPNNKFLFAADELTGLLYSFKILPQGRLKQNPNSPQPIPGAEFKGTINPRRVLGLQVHPRLSILYVGFFTVGKLGVYSYNETTGKLKFLRTVPNSGEALCWIYVNKAGTRLYTANAIDRSVSVYDLTDATQPVEIQKVTLKGDGNSFQIALDESTESFLHVVTQRAEPTDFFLPSPPFQSETQSNGIHTLKVNPQDGTLTEVDSSPIYILPVAGSRPQGIVAP